MCQVKLYEHKTNKSKLFVITNIKKEKQGFCGKTNEYKNIKHYQCLTPEYLPLTTTIDNIAKNYKLIDTPTGKDARQLFYIQNS